jgi:hypothetical protein
MNTTGDELDPVLKKLIIDARARIIWGESIEDVRNWLSACNIQKEEIDLVVDHCVRERGAYIRSMGVKDVVIGILLLLLGIADIIYISSPHYIHVPHRSCGYGLSLLLAGLGLWRLGTGVSRIIDGAKTKGSIPDME